MPIMGLYFMVLKLGFKEQELFERLREKPSFE